MNLMKNKKIVIAVMVVVAAIAIGYFAGSRQFGLRFGAINIENYNPAIMANGYISEKPITLSGASGDITTGDDLTVTDDATVSGGLLTVNSTATSSIYAKSSSATQGFCLEFNASSTNTLLNMTFSASSSASTVGIVPIIRYGACN